MVCKDADGSYISSDSTDTLGEYQQESIPEKEVCAFLEVAIYFSFSYIYVYAAIDDG